MKHTENGGWKRRNDDDDEGERGTECKKTKQRGKDKNVIRGHGGGKDNSSFV